MSKKKIAAPPPFGAGRFFKKHLPLAALLAVTALLYTGAGVLSGRLNLVDDHDYIVQYGHYDRPLSFAGLAPVFNRTSTQEMLHDYYRPLYTLVRSIDYRLYGTSPTGYHATSLLFYLLAVGSAYWILRQLLPSTLAALAPRFSSPFIPSTWRPWLGSWPAATRSQGPWRSCPSPFICRDEPGPARWPSRLRLWQTRRPRSCQR